MFFTSKKSRMPRPEEALPGRATAMRVGDKHFVNGHSITAPFPTGMQHAMFGMGCFWGAERKFWQVARRVLDRGRLRGRLHAEPDLRGGLLRARPGTTRSCSWSTTPSRSRYEKLLAVFWESHDPTQGMRAGQRHRHAVPLGHLHVRRRRSTRRPHASKAAVRAASRRRGPRPDHDRDRDGADVLLRRGLSPAVPGQEPGRLLRPRRHRRVVSDRRLTPSELEPRLLRQKPAVPTAGMVRVALFTLVVLLAACGDDDANAATMQASMRGSRASISPTSCAPAAPDCASAGDGVLKVGVGEAGVHAAELRDVHRREQRPRVADVDEPYIDTNGNGKFDGVWMFGGGRAALGVITDVEARAIAFDQGDTHDRRALRSTRSACCRRDMDMIRSDPQLAGARTSITSSSARRTRTTHPTRSACGDRRRPTTGRQPFVLERCTRSRVARDQGSASPRCSRRSSTIASTKLINDPANPMSLHG